MASWKRKTIAGVTSAATAGAGLAAVSLAAAAPAVANGDPDPTPYVVSVGDSFISGEGAAYSNHHIKPGDILFPDKVWQTPSGALTGTTWYSPTALPGPVWAQIYADTTEGGKPAQLIPGCSRSYSSPGNLGEGWSHHNLACSGATQPSVPAAAAKNGLLGQAYTVFKPGLDNFQGKFAKDPSTKVIGTLPEGATIKSQDILLKEFAAENDVKVVAMSIGGNDFGFADLVTTCAMNFTLAQAGCGKDKDKYVTPENLAKVTDAVTAGIQNTVNAMREAGYEDGSWKIVYQNPPLPVPNSETIKVPSGKDRNVPYGCPFINDDLDWIHETVYPKLTGAMTKGLRRSKAFRGDVEVVQIETTKTFEKHLVCGDGTVTRTDYAGGSGKNPPWQDDNGKKTEWVNWISIQAQGSANVSLKSTALHPNYWGQRALASCLSEAIATEGNATVYCEQSESEDIDEQGRPEMTLTDVQPLHLTVAGKPVIDSLGNQPGDVLTAVVGEGTFLPKADYTYSYQWLRDGKNITRATGDTYTLLESDADSLISVRVSVTQDGETARTTSDEFGPVKGEMLTRGRFTVKNGARVGDEFEIDDSRVEVEPFDAERTYQWLRNGVEIDGATTGAYVSTPADAGKTLSVKVTLSKEGIPPLTVESRPSDPVADGLMVVTNTPTVTGTASVGEELVADAADVTFSQTTDRTSYQWYRDGNAIPGANDAAYVIQGEDAEAELSVGLRGYAVGFRTALSAASDPTAPVAKAINNVVGVPVFDGTPTVNRLLTIDLTGVYEGKYPSAPTVEWFANGAKIAGADSLEYAPTVDDIGKSLSAKVTPRDVGWQADPVDVAGVPVVKISTKVAEDEKGPLSTKVKGDGTVGKKLTAEKATFDPADATRTVSWLRDGKQIATGDTYTLKVADAGKKITAKTTAAETATTTSASSTSTAVTVAKAGSTSSVSAKQKGKAKKKSKKPRTVEVTVSVAAAGVNASEVTGSATVKVGSKSQTVQVANGTATVTLKVKKPKSKRQAKKVPVSVTYDGNQGLKSSSAQATVGLK